NPNFELKIGDLKDPIRTLSYKTPDFKAIFSAIGVVAKAKLIIAGLDTGLHILQNGLSSRVLSYLPVVGSALSSAAHFIEDFRVQVLQRFSTLLSEAEKTIAKIKLEIYRALGPKDNGYGGLGILLPLDGDTTRPVIPNDVDVDLDHLADGYIPVH